jgi:hypothetical protein
MTIQIAALAAKLGLLKSLVDAAKSLWRAVGWPKAAKKPPVVLPAPPGRRRRWWGGDNGPTATAPVVGLVALLLAVGCSGPLSGLKPAEIVALCEQVAPCDPCAPGPTPPPAPVPGPPAPDPSPDNPVPAPDPGPALGDEIDLSSVTWLHRDPSSFPVTAELLDWGTDGRKHWVRYTHPDSWKISGGRVVGNVWILAEAKGPGRGWYGATFEHLLAQQLTDPPGQFSRKLEYRDPAVPFLQAEVAPIDRWRPRPGEEVVILISTITRGPAPAGAPVGRSIARKFRLP